MCFILFFTNVIAKESYSSLYIKITDTTTAIRNNNQNEAKKLFSKVRDEFKKVKNADSVKGKKVQELLNKEKSTLSEEDLREVTTALLAFEKEQNPVNDNEEKKKFQSRMNPALDVLEKAIQSKDVELMKKTVGDKAEVKASGGVKDLETAKKYIELGATRLGTSSGIAIVTGLESEKAGY